MSGDVLDEVALALRELLQQLSTTEAAVTRTPSSTWATSLGVNPLETIERSRKCFGSSMLIIDPKNSFISCGRSPMFEPLPEQNSCGLRLACQTSS